MIRIFSQYVSPKTLLLVALETLLIAFSLICAVRLRFWDDQAAFLVYTSFPDFILQALVYVVIFQMCLYFNDLYDLTTAWRRDDQVLRLSQSLGIASLLLGLLYFVVPSLLIGRGVFFINMILASSSILLSRIALDKAWPQSTRQHLLILGNGELALSVARELKKRGDLDVHLSGFLPRRGVDAQLGDSTFTDTFLGSEQDLESLVERDRISRIIVAIEDRRGTLPIAALVKLRLQGVVIEDAHSVISALTGRVWLSTVRPSWFVFSDGFRRSRVAMVTKRLTDICCGLVGLALSLPIMAIVAVVIRLDSKGPILYRQLRIGWKGKEFEVLKFRSMRLDAEQHGACWASVDDPRITKIGKYLRKFRLDELPQFVNVIRGDMSFVGPRPERRVFIEQLRKEIPYYDERHSVRPGLTGWAQVQYPYGASVEDSYRKLEYDLFYLKNMSALFDSAIIFQTVKIVLAGRNSR